MQGLDSQITGSLRRKLSDCEWNSKQIGESISAAFKDEDISPKEGYRNLYLAILGVEKGPRLAPILAELDREHVLNLLG
jgi:lysyl-tRNA synthetase class I